MRCDEAMELLGKLRDGELSPGTRTAVAEHIAGCRACASVASDLDRLGTALKAIRHRAPEGLVLRGSENQEDVVRAPLELPWQSGGPARGLSARDLPERGPEQHDWRSLARTAALIAVTATLSSLITWAVLTGSLGDSRASRRLAHDAVTAHVRSLLAGNSIQIASADPHTVKPWFSGRVEFAPSIRDLSSDGFPLAGARIDLVGDRRVGVAVYKRRLHTIDVFMWLDDESEPATADGTPSARAERGYNLIRWQRSGVTYLAVSDLNAGELLVLQGLL